MSRSPATWRTRRHGCPHLLTAGLGRPALRPRHRRHRGADRSGAARARRLPGGRRPGRPLIRTDSAPSRRGAGTAGSFCRSGRAPAHASVTISRCWRPRSGLPASYGAVGSPRSTPASPGTSATMTAGGPIPARVETRLGPGHPAPRTGPLATDRTSRHRRRFRTSPNVPRWSCPDAKRVHTEELCVLAGIRLLPPLGSRNADPQVSYRQAGHLTGHTEGWRRRTWC
jgi:hypothetical protein